MSFDHKAFSFNWSGFQSELAPLLSRSLSAGDSTGLVAFVEAHLTSCSNPYDGEQLEPGWNQLLEVGDIQELADFALTKYYDPAADHGLSGAWAKVELDLPPPARLALLGEAFSSASDVLFDPGRMGSYFQSPSRAQESLFVLQELDRPEIGEFVGFLRRIVAESNGLYVTF